MKDLDLVLRESYIRAIETALVTIPVYDSEAPSEAPNIYIVILDINTQQVHITNNYHNRIAITLNIVTKFKKPYIGSYKEVDNVTNSVKTIIMKGIDIGEDFLLTTNSLDNSTRLRDDTKTENVYRRILTFTHKILQLNN